MTTNDKKVLVILLVLLVYLLSNRWTHWNMLYGFLLAPIICYLPGIKVGKVEHFRKVNFNVIFFIVACLSIGTVAAACGAGNFIVNIITPMLSNTGTFGFLVIVFVFRNMPVAIESGTTTLLQIDNSIEEASTILGAGSGYSFRRISLPMLRNAFFSGLVYSFVKAITAVSAIIFLVSPRWDLVTSKIYTLFDQAKYSQAAAFVTMMVVILLVFIGIFNGLINLLLAPRSRVPKGAGIHEKTEETK